MQEGKTKTTGKKKKIIEGKRKAILAARSLEEKKALNVVLLDVSSISVVTDFFVIASGESKRQIKACVDHVEEILAKKDIYPDHLEGVLNLEWVLMDYGDVIVHVFTEEARAYYDLEGLWGDAPRIDFRTRKEKKKTDQGENKKGEIDTP